MAKPVSEMQLIIHADADPYQQALEVERLRLVLRQVRVCADCGPQARAVIDAAVGPEDGTAVQVPVPQIMIRPVEETL